eukprot:13696444-Heterocapsa_arctica.AAC.1
MLKAKHIQSHKREKTNKTNRQKHIVEEEQFEDRSDTEDNNNVVIVQIGEQVKPTMEESDNPMDERDSEDIS